MRHTWRTCALLAIILVSVTALRPAAQIPAPNPNFDFDTGNSATGVTPAGAVTLGPFNTFTEFDEACSRSRVLGGVHFVAATTESQAVCQPIGDLAFALVDRHVKGQTP